MEADIARAADLLRASSAAVALTGAGISTESGIPDFRTPGGIWDRYDPREFTYQRFVASAETRKKIWAWGLELFPQLRDAEPNAGHRALAELEARGHLRCIVTQNIDELHQRAGSAQVIEIHGTALKVACLSCGDEMARDDLHARLTGGDLDPHCHCGGLIKSKTVSFGQAMPVEETMASFDQATSCDVMLAVGSSLVVYPAAELVPTAVEAGAALIVVNLEPTPFDDIANVVLRGKAGDVLPAIVNQL